MISTKKKQIARVTIVLVAIFLAFSILEVYTRLQISSKNKKIVLGIYQNDQYTAQSLRPNAHGVLQSREKGEFSVDIKITSQGFRDTKEYQIPKPSNTFRILMLGDSFTLGHGVKVEEAFSKVLEKNLNEKTKEWNFEVINAAYASGFTWDEAYLFTKERGLSYEPDLVIENVWIGNDLTEFGEHDYPQLDENNLPKKIISKRTYVTEDGYLRAINVSKKRRLAGMLGFLNEKICDSSDFCKVLARPLVDATIKNIKNKLKPDKVTSIYIEFLQRELSEKTTKNWQIGQQMLIALEKLASNSKAKFIIVNIPIKEQIYDPGELLRSEQLYTTRIEEFTKSENISFCDISPELKEEPREAYFPNDSHLTTIGHMQAAEAIERCIKSESFLPLESQSMDPFSLAKI